MKIVWEASCNTSFPGALSLIRPRGGLDIEGAAMRVAVWLRSVDGFVVG